MQLSPSLIRVVYLKPYSILLSLRPWTLMKFPLLSMLSPSCKHTCVALVQHFVLWHADTPYRICYACQCWGFGHVTVQRQRHHCWRYGYVRKVILTSCHPQQQEPARSPVHLAVLHFGAQAESLLQLLTLKTSISNVISVLIETWVVLSTDFNQLETDWPQPVGLI